MTTTGSVAISTHQLRPEQFLRRINNNHQLNRDNYKRSLNSKGYIVSLFDSKLNPKTGVIWSGKAIIEESSVLLAHKLFRWEPAPIFSQKLTGVSINLPDNAFYHFLIEDLPRFIEAFNYNPKAQVIIGSKSKYLLDVVKLLKVQDYLFLDYPVQCQELMFSEKSLGGIFNKADHELLNSLKGNIKTSHGRRKLLIIRGDSDKGFLDRGIRYSSVLHQKLENLGFEKVFLEKLSVSEQISLINSADMLVGFHGAGLANMIWMKQDTKVFEITETRFTSHFEHIATICNIKFNRYIASELVELTESQFKRKFSI
jgi:capsular polysaccharide biosynthesis protein